MTDPGLPAGILRFTSDLTEEQRVEMERHMRDRLAADGGQIMVLGPGVEYHPAPGWRAPSPQDVFTLRSVMAAHRAAAQNLARLRAQQARDVRAAADIGLVGGQLGNAARVELTAAEIERAEEREAEVRAELAQAHSRATGRPLPPSPVPPHAYGPGTVRAVVPADPRRVAEQELTAARLAEQAARERLVALGSGPERLRALHARHLRKQAWSATGLAVLGTLTTVLGFPAVVPVAAFSLMCAVLLLGLYGITESRRRIAQVAQQVPDASADHDVALRRLVAAEAGAVAAGLPVTPSTLDADVEAAAAAEVPLTW